MRMGATLDLAPWSWLPWPPEDVVLVDRCDCFFTCVNWKRHSLSSSILCWRIPSRISRLVFSRVGSTKLSRVLFLISLSWISVDLRLNCLWWDWAMGALHPEAALIPPTTPPLPDLSLPL